MREIGMLKRHRSREILNARESWAPMIPLIVSIFTLCPLPPWKKLYVAPMAWTRLHWIYNLRGDWAKVGAIQHRSGYVLCRVYTYNLTLVNIAVSMRYAIEVGVACRNIGPWSNNLRLLPCIKVCKIARTLVCPREITRKLEFRHVCAVT